MNKISLPRVVVLISLGTLLAASASKADTSYFWTGAAGDSFIGTPGNWAGDLAPTGNSTANERLYFYGLPGQVNNDRPNATYLELFFSDGSYGYLGNAATVAQLTLSVNATNSSDVWVGPEIRGSDIFFDYDDFRADQSTPAWMQFAVGGTIHLTDTSANRFSTYGFGAFQNRVVLAGSDGKIIADSPAEAWVGDATLALNGGNQPGLAGRVGSNVHVLLDNGARINLNGYSGESADFIETISQLTVVGSAIVGVEHGNSSFDTSLVVPPSITEGGLALYNGTGGELGASVGPAPHVFLEGQGTSSFLGPQQFYLNGDVNYGGNFAKYSFAAYDAVRGVISATTLENPDNLSMSTSSDIVQIDQANSASLADDPDLGNRDYKLSANATLKALAFNGDLLFGESSPGNPHTITLEHLLLTHDTAAVAVNLDFGTAAGTITTENWFTNHFPEVDVYEDIAGSNSITIRGFGELNYRGTASFDGILKISGGGLNLADAGSFANVQTIIIGAGPIRSTLDLYGPDNTGGTPVLVNRLKDDIQIIAEGTSSLLLESDVAGVTPVTEVIGSIQVNGSGSDFALIVQAGDLNTHTNNSTAIWQVASLAFGANASNSHISLEAYGDTNAIAVSGSTILLANGNSLSITQGQGATVSTPGIQTGSGSSLMISGDQGRILNADLDLQDGSFLFSGSEFTLSGSLVLGTSLETHLNLSSPTFSPVILINGDLTLAGTMHIAQDSPFESGTWLLFEYTGSLTNEGISIIGLDGSYTLTFNEDSHSVYLNAVPEPSTYALLALGCATLFVARRRHRSHKRPDIKGIRACDQNAD